MRKVCSALPSYKLACFATLLLAGMAQASDTLYVESWRTDDANIWSDTIIPAFNKHHPDIKIQFSPTPPTDYNSALQAKLQAGSAGDIITCRPFDASLQLFDSGYLEKLNGLKGLEDFSDVAKSAWVTDDGREQFCLPMASVIHGFIYNKEIFEELNLTVPKTQDEFFKVLAKIKSESRYTPLDMGTADQWEAATMGFQNIGPNYWKGEAGRKGLIDGTAKLTDQAYVDTWKELAKWKPYLGRGFEAQKYSDSQNLFTLGRAAIYPAGSWDIQTFNNQADFEFGAFPPPVLKQGDTCYISDHTDIGMGINTASKHKEAAKIFLNWMASAEFGELFANAVPGFFPLSNHSVAIKDPAAQTFISWRQQCESTIRNSYQILSRGTPNLENQLWNVSAQVINGTMTPEQAATETQQGLEQWYGPQQ
ncbi:ABC transporter substrate-binding protein [Marinomonas posidonica]|uniref:Probable sugar-binding periplasmic protein n=1 Tax=Marinomonas posidonica (strain CECT 7376 / NCIMB 14433 / IVIA-Po-181) TaxID=491952 RepID=F6CUP0_MARPP|nr:ABC transporter substrate-binding protein [Marinomonas posidonica]AEF54150.1 extracellular solute-binding protein family 1 [Marinomonas posidonica IVIA-Po-181]